jgi:thiol-disulfide isomerase/thioredoxin
VRLKVGAFLLGGLLLGVGVGYFVFWNKPPAAGSSSRRLPPTVGSPAPDFGLPVLGGGYQKLSDLWNVSAEKRTPAILNFWATWCTPCKVEMPLLERYSRKYSGKLAVLGINYGEKPEVVQPFVTGMGITFSILLDQSQMIADIYFVKNFPTTFFIDENGTIRAQHLGVLSEDILTRYLSTIGIKE